MISEKNSGTVLVVDDSPEALSLINDTLESAGYDVLVALEGNQALTIVKRIRPDMILLDAVMPNMDGFETCVRLKENPDLADIPVIFMTGLTETENLVKGLEAGGVDYLTKPINTDELLARMKVHQNNARQTSSAYKALESTGQFLCTIDGDGRIVWATPQTQALLARASVSPDQYSDLVARPLADWLAEKRETGDKFAFSDLDYPLEAVFIDDLVNNEKLVKLLDQQKTPDHELLREKLELTVRESQVLLWISNGKTNWEIAQILEMSPRTVNKHLEQIYPKLGVENRTAAARIALQVIADRNH